MCKLFERPENIKWDNIQPISPEKLKKLIKGKFKIEDSHETAERLGKQLPPVDESLVNGIVREIEKRENSSSMETVSKEHLAIVRASKLPSS